MVFVSERDLAAVTETAQLLSVRSGSSESLMEALREHLPKLLHADSQHRRLRPDASGSDGESR